MSLPTVQPFDYPDWGTPGIFTTVEASVTGIAGPNELIGELATGYYSHALIVFYPTFPLENYTVSIQQWTASPSEGGSLLFAVETTLTPYSKVVVPTTSAGTFLRIFSVDSTAYPHSCAYSITLFSAAGYMTGWPGGITALNEESTVPGVDALDMKPVACGPGPHHLGVWTDAASWTIALYIWNTVGAFRGWIIADDTTANLWNIEFSPPASSWFLQFSNNDVGDCDAFVMVTRDPT